MIGKISNGLMKAWKDNFKQNTGLPFLTESSSISLDLLNEFLSEAKQTCPGFNGLRIYFVRYDTVNDGLTDKIPHIRLMPGTNVSQVSLAIVPVKNFDPVTLRGEDFTQDGQIFNLSFCHPSREGDKAVGTGHCPPLGCPDPPPSNG